MAEKKIVVDAIRFTYSGMFSMDELFREVDSWTEEHGFHREIKKKGMHVENDSKKMEYIFELWQKSAEYSMSVVRVKLLFKDVVDFELTRGEHSRTMQKGHVLVIIDGFVEDDLEHKWVTKPMVVFWRTLFEKFIWQYWMNAHDSHVSHASYDLYNRLFRYFKRYKH